MTNDVIAMVGAGRTGSRAAKLLEGKCQLRIIDRDYIDATTVRDCPQYDKNDIDKPKATTLATKIRSATAIDASLDKQNNGLLQGARIVVDCTDNYATRIAINEWCWNNHTPWIYTAALGKTANCATITPPAKPCFECWAPEPKETTSCSEQGVDEGALDNVAELAASEATNLLNAKPPKLQSKLWSYDATTGKETTVETTQRAACPCCGNGTRNKQPPKRQCGTGEYFINSCAKIDLKTAAKLLNGEIKTTFVRFKHHNATASLFADGRMLVRCKTEKEAEAANDYALSKTAIREE